MRVHASCVVVGEAGVLLRGPSGSGKSRLAYDLLWEGARAGLYAALVGDDRVALQAHHGRVVARAVPEIAGLLEVRGLGLVSTAPAPACVVRLVVDCLAEPGARMPEAGDTVAVISGTTLPRMAMRVEPGLAARILPRVVAGMSRP